MDSTSRHAVELINLCTRIMEDMSKNGDFDGATMMRIYNMFSIDNADDLLEALLNHKNRQALFTSAHDFFGKFDHVTVNDGDVGAMLYIGADYEYPSSPEEMERMTTVLNMERVNDYDVVEFDRTMVKNFIKLFIKNQLLLMYTMAVALEESDPEEVRVMTRQLLEAYRHQTDTLLATLKSKG